jgi:hypothetical protein
MQPREAATVPLSRSRRVRLQGILLLFLGALTVAPGASGDQDLGRGKGGSERGRQRFGIPEPTRTARHRAP